MNAGQKWLQLFLDITSYEFEHASDGELLSEGADKLVDKYPILGRGFIIAAGVLITSHLANLLAPRYDIMNPRFWDRTRGR